MLDPYPFDEPSLTFKFPARHVKGKLFSSAAELQKGFALGAGKNAFGDFERGLAHLRQFDTFLHDFGRHRVQILLEIDPELHFKISVNFAHSRGPFRLKYAQFAVIKFESKRGVSSRQFFRPKP